MRTILILFVLTLLQPTLLYSQLKIGAFYHSESNGGLCSSSLILNEDSTYFRESGCEGSSGISAGKWKRYKDTLAFTPFSNKTQTFISSITATQLPVDSVYVTILDKNDNNITSEIAMGIYVEKLGLYPFTTKTVTKNVAYKRPGGKLYLKRLARVLRRDFTYNTDTVNNFVIKLNIPGWFFKYDQAQWDNGHNFKLVYKDGKLADPNSSPDFPTIYTRE